MYKLSKRCQTCDEEFLANRSDQKYCCTSCKNFHNNRRRSKQYQLQQAKQQIMQSHQNIIWQNREVLKLHAGKQMPLIELQELGFTTNYISRFKSIAGKKRTLFFCFDIAYEFRSKCLDKNKLSKKVH